MEEKYTAANWAVQLFSSPQCHVFTFSVHLGLSPAWKLRLNLCAPLLRVCKWTRTSVCTCTPLAVPGFSALLFQPGVSKFWFPLGPPRNWKQRLSLEVCLVCVCVCYQPVCVYICVVKRAVCAFVHPAYAHMHLFTRIFLRVRLPTRPMYMHTRVCCRHVEAVRLHRERGGWIKFERWESRQSLLHMQSWRHGLRLSKCLAIYKNRVRDTEKTRGGKQQFNTLVLKETGLSSKPHRLSID